MGAALSMQLPTGQYLEDKLINLGGNRFTFSPQLGVRQKYYNWSFEATGMARLHTDNTSFFNGKRRQQDPYYTATVAAPLSNTASRRQSRDGINQE